MKADFETVREYLAAPKRSANAKIAAVAALARIEGRLRVVEDERREYEDHPPGIGDADIQRVFRERDALRAQVKTLLDVASDAWGVIANAGRGDWTLEHPDWQAAAARWRERYHEVLRAALEATKGGGDESGDR